MKEERLRARRKVTGECNTKEKDEGKTIVSKRADARNRQRAVR